MAKLFIQSLPSREELEAAVKDLEANIDTSSLYSNMLFMKVASELETNFDSLLSQYHLSSGRFTLLILLRKSPAGLKPSELALLVGVTQATISGLLSNLEKMGLVSRESHQNDGRAFVIKLSEKGESLVQEIFPKWHGRLASFWGTVSSDEKSGLDVLMGKMIERTSLLSSK